MNPAIPLAVVAGSAWASNIVVVRWALDRTRARPLTGALVGLSTAALTVSTVAFLSAQSLPDSASIWKFALIGAIAPGSSQGLFVAAIGDIGTSRSSVLVSTNPLVSVILASIFLGEGWRAVILVGTLLTVVGGALISWEPAKGFGQIGVLLALATAATFGLRDVIARQVVSSVDVSPLWTSAIVLTSASAVVGVMSLMQSRKSLAREVLLALPSFTYSGLAISVALTSLLAAFDRGQVGLVAPLANASQSLVVVALGTIAFGARERTTRILVALVLVAVGGILITTA